MKAYFLELVTDACLFAFGVDMLYLYYAGVWCEPVKAILYVELTLFAILPPFAGLRLVYYLKNEVKK